MRPAGRQLPTQDKQHRAQRKGKDAQTRWEQVLQGRKFTTDSEKEQGEGELFSSTCLAPERASCPKEMTEKMSLINDFNFLFNGAEKYMQIHP